MNADSALWLAAVLVAAGLVLGSAGLQVRAQDRAEDRLVERAARRVRAELTDAEIARSCARGTREARR